MPKPFFTAALFLTLAPTLYAQAFGSPEMQADRAHRDPAIHWPAAYSPDVAPVYSHNELLIHASCHTAFAKLADAPTWPTWFPLAKDVTIDTPRPVAQGTLLHLKIFNSPIASRIVEFVPDQRISWIPYGSDETETRHGHYHAWRFTPQDADCLVDTEETGIGPGDLKDPPTGSHLMHKAHELWLDGLRFAAEE